MNNSFFESLTAEPSCEQMNVRRERKQLALLALSVLWIYICSLLVQLVLSLVFSLVAPSVMEGSYWTWILQSSMYVLAIPSACLILRFCRVSKITEKRSIPFPIFLGLLAICFAMSLAGNLIGTAVNEVISMLTGKPIENAVAEMTQDSSFGLNLLFVAILAPVFEELFYRKMIIDRLRHYGAVPAVLISGILFGLIHGNFSQFFYAMMIGLVLGGVYLYTGKLRYTIAIHVTINFVCGVFTAEAVKRMGVGKDAAFTFADALQALSGYAMLFSYMALLAIAVVGAIVTVIYLIPKYRKPPKAEPSMKGGEWARALLLNPAVWALLAWIGVMFVLSVLG